MVWVRNRRIRFDVRGAVLPALVVMLAVFALACGESDAPREPAPPSEAAPGSSEVGRGDSAPPDRGSFEGTQSYATDAGRSIGSTPREDPPRRKPNPPAPPGVLEAEAEMAWDEGDKGGALTLLSRAVADRPESAEARSRFGRKLLSVTAFELAREHLEKAAELSPADPQVQLDLVTLYENTGETDRAAEARARAESLAPDRAIVQDEQGFYTLD